MSPSTDASARDFAVGRWLLLLALLATIALRWPLLEVPLERDEGEYAYIAWRMSEGDVPYLDAFDQKPPAIFAAYWLTFRLIGETVWDLRFGLLLWMLATVLIVHALGRRVVGPLAGGFGALAFGLASASPALLAHAANTEIYMLLPMTASVLFLLRGIDSERATDWLLAGALAMAAFWFKQVAATSGLFILLAACIARGGIGRRARRCAWMAVGAVLVSAPIAGAFLRADAWDPFIDAVFLHNVAYLQSTSWAVGIGNLGRALGLQAPDFWALWALALLGIGHASTRGRGAWPLAWTAFLAVGISSGLYFREHYFIQWLPGIALLAGLGGAVICREVRARGATVVAVPIAAMCFLAPPTLARMDLLTEEPDRIARRIYGLNPFPEARVIADLIARSSAPDDTVFILGSEPEILFLARRRSATRYIFTYPLTGGYADSVERQMEALREVEAASPLFVVVVNVAASHAKAPGVELPLFDGIEQMVATRYRLEALAYAHDNENPFRLLEGGVARRFMKENGAAAEAVSSLRVYRRKDP